MSESTKRFGKKELDKKEKMLSKKERKKEGKKEESIISQIHYPTPFMIPGKQPGRSSFPPKCSFYGLFVETEAQSYLLDEISTQGSLKGEVSVRLTSSPLPVGPRLF